MRFLYTWTKLWNRETITNLLWSPTTFCSPYRATSPPKRLSIAKSKFFRMSSVWNSEFQIVHQSTTFPITNIKNLIFISSQITLPMSWRWSGRSYDFRWLEEESATSFGCRRARSRCCLLILHTVNLIPQFAFSLLNITRYPEFSQGTKI